MKKNLLLGLTLLVSSLAYASNCEYTANDCGLMIQSREELAKKGYVLSEAADAAYQLNARVIFPFSNPNFEPVFDEFDVEGAAFFSDKNEKVNFDVPILNKLFDGHSSQAMTRTRRFKLARPGMLKIDEDAAFSQTVNILDHRIAQQVRKGLNECPATNPIK